MPSPLATGVQVSSNSLCLSFLAGKGCELLRLGLIETSCSTPSTNSFKDCKSLALLVNAPTFAVKITDLPKGSVAGISSNITPNGANTLTATLVCCFKPCMSSA